MPTLFVRIAAFCILLGMAAGLDVITGPASPTLFYLAAVAIITTKSGVNFGMSAVLVSVAACFVIAPAETGISALVIWNALTRFIVFSGGVAICQWEMEGSGGKQHATADPIH